MPKIVDHKERHEIIAKAAITVIARDGFEKTTMRNIAREAEISYGSLFHYFDSKDAVLMATIQYMIEKQVALIAGVQKEQTSATPLEILRAVLVEDAVVTSRSRDTSIVWAAFITHAMTTSHFEEEHDRLSKAWLKLLQDLLVKSVKCGEAAPSIDVELEAMTLWALCAGINQRGLTRTKSFRVRQQTTLIDAYLAKLKKR